MERIKPFHKDTIVYDSVRQEEFDMLKEHIGHRVVVACYGKPENPRNVAIECEDCYVVLYDIDNPQFSE